MSHPDDGEDQRSAYEKDIFGGNDGDDSNLSDLGAMSDDEDVQPAFTTVSADPPARAAPAIDETPKLPSFKKRTNAEDRPSPATYSERTYPARGSGSPARSEVRPPRRPSPTYDDGRSEPDDPEPAAPIDPQKAAIEAVRRDFEMALKSGSSRRSKKDDLELESQTDEMLAKLRMRMTEVADLDRAYNNERKPAISKIKLLPVVSEQLRKTSLHDAMLENGLLEAVRLWLEPLDDGSLPALDIQLELFNFLLKAPIHTEHLRESGMGKLVVFYTKCNRVDTRISRISEELVAKWIRPLIQRSANYKDRSIRTASSAATARPRSTLKRLMDDRREEDLSPGMAARVQVPRYTVPSYDIMPSASPLVQQNAGRKQQPEYMQRLKAHMTKNKTRAARH